MLVFITCFFPGKTSPETLLNNKADFETGRFLKSFTRTHDQLLISVQIRCFVDMSQIHSLLVSLFISVCSVAVVLGQTTSPVTSKWEIFCFLFATLLCVYTRLTVDRETVALRSYLVSSLDRQHFCGHTLPWNAVYLGCWLVFETQPVFLKLACLASFSISSVFSNNCHNKS